MRRPRLALTSTAAALIVAALFAGPAQAAVPTVGSLAVTNIQAVSALLKGEVDPNGLATTYAFEYSTQASFSGAVKTATTVAGSDTASHPARVAISGLTANTTYHYRLVANNSSGSASAAGTFTTTSGFGFRAGTQGFAVRAIADGGGAAVKAGSHPYQLNFEFGFNQGGGFEDQPGTVFPDGDLRELGISLPAGLILNPTALSQCSVAAFATPRSSPFEFSRSGENCPDSSQVGTVDVGSARDGGQPRRFGLFNLKPPAGVAAQLGFAPFGSPVVFDLTVREGSDTPYALSLQAHNVSQSLDISTLSLDLWGVPWAASHDVERGDCLDESEPEFGWAKCSVGPPAAQPPQAYVSLPADCPGQLEFGARASSWQQPTEVSAEALNRNSQGQPVAVGFCEQLPFAPAPLGFLSDRKASSPSGFEFRLSSDQHDLTEPEKSLSASPRKIVVRLPEGVTINPSVGAGLGTCAPAQFAAETPGSAPGAGCPNASKIGEFSAKTALFAEAFEGSVYLATPDNPETSAPAAENPFDALVAVYLVAKAPTRGVQIKLAGQIVPDPATGNLTAIFSGLPQLPYTDLAISFHTGQRAFLVTPAACGNAVTQFEVEPWAAGPATVRASSGSPIETGIGGGPCPGSGTPPFAPTASAGALNSNVGSYTPYFIHLTRQDTEQEITSYSLVLPKGITGKLAGIPFCPDADIAAARQAQGATETAQPSCPAASQVGRTLSSYGVGAALTSAPGRIFLAGPYHGAPLSLVTINSATIGPFDLGTIVIRSAFQIDPRTAQLQIDSRASDPIPHIIDGIPLHLRDIRIYIDRFEFTRNPSSCEPSQLVSTLTGSGATFASSSDDSVATASSPFQLLNCLTLGFRPKLGIRLRGPHHRGAYPSLRATFAARGPQDSNLKGIDVTLPHSEFLAQNHIKTICTQVQFAAELCPAGSVYGHAVAYTPLFDEPLRGDVYLRSSSHRLPDLVASLRSGSIRIVLEGKIGPAKQGIRTLFSNLPDAPISRFVLTLNGGKGGLLVNSADVCRAPPSATIRALGQNNIGASFTTTLRGQCKGGKGGHPKQKKQNATGGKR